MNWLQTIADEDKIDLEAAAVHFVLSGATMSATEWANLESEGRAKVLVAQKVVRAHHQPAAEQDPEAALNAAREYASVDGGRQAARLMARAAAHGVAAAIRQKAQG